MSAAKKKDEPILEIVELSTDREQGLSKNFEDPVLEDLIPGLVQASESEPLSVTEEAMLAVKELVQETAPEPEGLPIPDPDSSAIDLSGDFGQEKFDASAEKVPDPLPQTVSPDEKVERSMLLSMPDDSIEEPAVFMLDTKSVPTIDLRWDMSEKLFDLVLSEKAFEGLVQESLEAIMIALKAQAGSILELDHEKEDFFFRASFGGATSLDNLKAFRVPLTKGIVGHVAETGQPLLLRDLEEDKLQMRAISAGVGFEAKTCMAAPIIVGGQAYGVIEVFNKNDSTLYDEADLRALEDGVKMLSKILEVRFLMAELMRRVK